MKKFTIRNNIDSITIEGEAGEFTFEFSQRRKKAYKTSLAILLREYGTEAVGTVLHYENIFAGR